MANGHLSSAYADDILAAVLTRNFSGLPTTYYVGLTLDLPTDSDGTGLLAPADVAGYHRVPVPAESASWASLGVGSRSMESDVDVAFAAAQVDWGQINGYTLHDALVDGRFLGYGITNPFTILAGMAARLPAGAIVVTQPS